MYIILLICLVDARQYLHQGWHFMFEDQWYPAQVPSTLHLDLLQNGLIKDPYYGTNLLDLYHLEFLDWKYALNFLSEPSHQTLTFEGLDTHCDVYLNGQIVLNANNMFRTWSINVQLQELNNLTIQFHSAAKHDMLKEQQAKYHLPYNYSYSRKAAYHYGWDWGPRIVTCGIWKDVYLDEITNIPQIESVHVRTLSLENNIALLEFDISVKNFKISHYFNMIQILHDDQIIHQSTFLNKFIRIEKQIKNPSLWWPRGHGQQYLNRFTFKLIHQMNQKVLDMKIIKTGIKTAQWIKEDDKQGKSFYLKINGKPIYMMGANYIPPDMFMPRFNNYEKIIQDALNANYNTLRLWGGGQFENDRFYQLCDQYGLMIWHDLMFACAFYPADEDFLSNIKEEIIDNVKRLRNHPSIVIWNGNNEIEIGWREWGWKNNRSEYEIQEMTQWYNKLFLEAIPETLKMMDPDRFYYPTSPTSSFNQFELNKGDLHFWGVWASSFPIESYSEYVGRFNSEYGMQAILDFESIKQFCPQDQFKIDSFTMQIHERHVQGWPLIKHYIQEYVLTPTSFKNYIYATQIIQYYSLQLAITSLRSQKPYNMGSLYWQINDVWPVVSWSTVDYYGCWKAGHYAAKKYHQSTIVTIINSTQVYLITEQDYVYGNVLVKILDSMGSVCKNYTFENVSATFNSSIFIGVIDEFDKERYMSVIEFKEDYFPIFFGRPKDFKLAVPDYQMRWISNNEIRLESFSIMRWVKVEIEKEECQNLDENYFDLIPGYAKVIKVGMKREMKDIRLQSLWDSYQ